MDGFKLISNYGRGNGTRDFISTTTSNSVHCPPAPSLNTSCSSSVASGRAAQVLRQIKGLSSYNSTIDLSNNQIFLRCALTHWYKYNVEFEPTITSRTKRFMMINQLAQSLNGLQKLYDGQFIYVPNQLSKEFFLLDDPICQSSNEIRVRFIDTLSIEQIPIDLVNILFRSAFDHGRESMNSVTNLHNHRLKRSWNGTITQIQRKEDGLLLTIDFIPKATTTCYEELERFYVSNDYESYARKELANKLVLTRYDNRTQRIDDINFQLTPATCKVNDESQTTLVDYYLSKFDIIIEDPDQPLIVYYPRRLTDANMPKEQNYLVPELCYLTGLTDRAHRNARARKTNSILRLDSSGRQSEMNLFNDILQRNSSTIQYLTLWGLDIVSNHISRSMFMSNESTRLNRTENSSSEDDDDYEQRNVHEYDYSYGHFSNPVELNHWLLIYPKIDRERALIFCSALRQIAEQHGMFINEPTHIEMDDDETESYAKILRSSLNEKVQLASIIVKSRRIDRYNTIKRICCIEIPTASEIVLRSTISDDEILSSVALNVARDINLKLGGEIRTNNINLPNAMIIGIGTWSREKVNYQSSTHLHYVLSLVGSINYEMTKYFSHAKSYRNEDELRRDVGNFVRLALDAYFQENKIYPRTIFIGRNVSCSIDDLSLIKTIEIPLILETIEIPKPRIVIFTFMRTMIYDFHRYVEPKKTTNVDHFDAKDPPSYFFYLSSHRERCSAFQTRQFLVLFDNTDLSAQKVQRLILYLTCHIPQRRQFFVPSICRFAQRLSSLVGETLGESPKYVQSKNLFYL